MEEKKWGKHKFWGLGPELDPSWVLTDIQKKLQENLIETCRKTIRPHAVVCDQNYVFPRKSLEALSELGLLGLLIPKHLGGLGENHSCLNMVVETIARYGCASTAMVYVMHTASVAAMLFRHHHNPHLTDLLKRINKDKLVGTLSYSDPATGGHFWFPLSSKAKTLGVDGYKMLKFASWVTSAGFADYYVVQGISPEVKNKFSNLSLYLFYKDEIRANAGDWSSLGLHGNQSGPMVFEKELSAERMVGPIGDGEASDGEITIPFAYLYFGSCWNGLSMGIMDLAKKHVTTKIHADVGKRICDYPKIQDYFGECVAETNTCRLFATQVSQRLDEVTNNCDWSMHEDITCLPRSPLEIWFITAKCRGCANVSKVSETMLHATGGTGYSTALGLERLYRDAKAGWVMGPTNEICTQVIGKLALIDEKVDYWEERVDTPVLNHEVQKLNKDEKRQFAQKLLEEVAREERSVTSPEYQGTDFENPFNTAPPTNNNQDTEHSAALNPETFTPLHLEKTSEVNDEMTIFTFRLPNTTDHTGCLAGQYIQVRIVTSAGSVQTRYISPTSPPDQYGQLEFAVKFESHGILSLHLKQMKPGDIAEFRGPLGGFEYAANKVEEIMMLASGICLTPFLQILRCAINDKEDKTKMTLFYHGDKLQDMLCKEELDKYAGDSRVDVIYSVNTPEEDWDGEEGFIKGDMIHKYKPLDKTKNMKVVICGGPTLIVSLLTDLRNLGYESQDIYIYGQFGAEFIHSVYGKNALLSSHKL